MSTLISHIFPIELYDVNIPEKMDELVIQPHLGGTAPQIDINKPQVQKSDNQWVRWSQKYEKDGMRRTASAILLVHDQTIPHLIAVRDKNTGKYTLPGGTLKPGEPEKEGLLRKLSKFVLPRSRQTIIPSPHVPKPTHSTGCHVEADPLAKFWRIAFNDLQLPYLPPHVSRPKQIETLHLCSLPQEGAVLGPLSAQALPVYKRHREVVTVPLAQLWEPTARETYGVVLASIPVALSRVSLHFYVTRAALDAPVLVIRKTEPKMGHHKQPEEEEGMVE